MKEVFDPTTIDREVDGSGDYRYYIEAENGDHVYCGLRYVEKYIMRYYMTLPDLFEIKGWGDYGDN